MKPIVVQLKGPTTAVMRCVACDSYGMHFNHHGVMRCDRCNDNAALRQTCPMCGAQCDGAHGHAWCRGCQWVGQLALTCAPACPPVNRPAERHGGPPPGFSYSIGESLAKPWKARS